MLSFDFQRLTGSKNFNCQLVSSLFTIDIPPHWSCIQRLHYPALRHFFLGFHFCPALWVHPTVGFYVKVVYRQYQPCGKRGTFSLPDTPHRLQHLTTCLIQNGWRGLNIGKTLCYWTPNRVFMVRPRTILNLVSGLISTQISTQAHV